MTKLISLAFEDQGQARIVPKKYRVDNHQKLFHWIKLPDGKKIALNKVGVSVGFRKGKPVVFKKERV
jgi:hypothetical protein